MKNPTDNQCAVCKNQLFPNPLISFQNMPSVAQHLPDQQTVKYDTGINLDIYQCGACGLVQLNQDPVSYFKEVIRAVAYSPSMKEFRLRQFKNFVQEYKLTNKKVLEIGSGKGEYLQLMQEAGADAYGIEFADNSVKAAVENGLNVSKGFIDSGDYKIPNSPFDAFFIISFFEHLPDPNTVLKGLLNNLQEGAVGIVEVPNFDMMLRENLFSEFMLDHLFYFTSSTLRTTLELNGFEVLKIEEVWHNYILSATVKKRTPLNLESFISQKNHIQVQIKDFIDKHNSVAVWGAGHQSFAILSIMELGNKIKYIVDSAPFKQGKFSPATHIAIMPPETLNIQPVEAIILMAGSYNSEIKSIIKEKYGKNIQIAILTESGLEA